MSTSKVPCAYCCSAHPGWHWGSNEHFCHWSGGWVAKGKLMGCRYPLHELPCPGAHTGRRPQADGPDAGGS